MGDKYADRELVWVKPLTGSAIKYGFRTNADGATQSALGHNLVTNVYPVGLVIGANAPKPPRASKLKSTGVESSFCDVDSVSSAKAAGWKVRPGKVRSGGAGKKSKTVYVDIDGVRYAWKMPNDTYTNTASDRSQLGIQDATAATSGLVFGASYPKPARASFVGISTTGANTFTTFVEPTKEDNLPTGWGLVKSANDSRTQ